MRRARARASSLTRSAGTTGSAKSGRVHVGAALFLTLREKGVREVIPKPARQKLVGLQGILGRETRLGRKNDEITAQCGSEARVHGMTQL